MKNRDFLALAQKLVPRFPPLAIKIPFLLKLPIGDLLRGIAFESHSYDSRLFYVWLFVIPLFIPTNTVGFNLGKRVAANSTSVWNADDPNLIEVLDQAIREEYSPYLQPEMRLLDVVSLANKDLHPHDLHGHQTIAYSLARANEIQKSMKAFARLIDLLDPKIHWQLDMLQRARLLSDLLSTDPPRAQQQLEDWKLQSVVNLKLEKYI